jgi:hypothetical protein
MDMYMVQKSLQYVVENEYPTKQFFIYRPFIDKNDPSNRQISKNLLTSIFTLADFAKIPKKI